MSFELDKYNSGQAVMSTDYLAPVAQTLEQRLSDKLKAAQKNVARFEKLQKLLNKNPEVQEIINLLGYRY